MKTANSQDCMIDDLHHELQNDLKRKDDELSRQKLFITQLNGQIDFLEQENDNLL